MKQNRLLYLIGDIDDRFVEAAEFPKKKSIVRPILKYGSIAACFCLLVAAGFGIRHGINTHNVPISPSTSENSATEISTSSNVQTQQILLSAFASTITKDPDSDAYGEDELHHIDVRTAEGFYHQLGLDEYADKQIPSTISLTDFGEYIGKIVEVDDSNYHGNSVESQEPALAGADVYYYAPTGKNKAFIIVKLGDQCSMFIDDSINESVGFQKGLAFFDVQSADDIQSIEYHIDIPKGSEMVTSVQNTITDAATIEALYDLLCGLTPEDYSQLPEHIGTPQWLADAWAAYQSDPNAPVREDYYITIRLNDGTVLQDIHYQPYLGNGYVANMQELTPEQNTTLRNLLK